MNRLFYYVSQGKHQEAESLIAQGANVNAEVESLTPLDKAVQNNDVRMVELLIEAGADVNHGHPKTGKTALHDAVTEDPRILELLLRAGADVEGGKPTSTPLCIAAAFRKRDAYDRLIEAGANPNATMHGIAACEEIEKPSPFDGAQRVFERMRADNRNPELQTEFVRQMMSQYPTVELYAAHRGRGTYVFSLHLDEFTDPEVEAWAKRYAEILFTPGLLAEFEEQYLAGSELDQARRERKRLDRWLTKQARKKARIADANGQS